MTPSNQWLSEMAHKRWIFLNSIYIPENNSNNKKEGSTQCGCRITLWREANGAEEIRMNVTEQQNHTDIVSGMKKLKKHKKQMKAWGKNA